MFERLAAGEPPLDARSLAGARVAAIGPGTARALEAHGIRPDVVPERAVAESLAEALEQIPVSRALVARAAGARDVVPDALRARGAEVDVVALYETVAETPEPRLLERPLRPITSPSPPPRRSASSSRRRRPERISPAPARLDRPGHERDAARARARAPRRGGPPRRRGLVEAMLADATGDAGAHDA